MVTEVRSNTSDGFSYLSNEHLEVEIANVGGYAGSRFDWTGFVTQVYLKQGNHTFCTFEHKSGTLAAGGGGLCGEFGIFKPIGYEEVEVGGLFPKLGVGLLKRVDSLPFAFDAKYPIEPFQVVVDAKATSIQYTIQPKECRGYAVKLIKKLVLSGSSLKVDYSLENVGTHTINTHEYVHNFVNIDGHSIGPDYRLSFSVPFEADLVESEYTPTILNFSGQEIRWTQVPSRDFYSTLVGYSNHEAIAWELVHEPSQVGIRETAAFPVSMIALWGRSDVVSPELFIDLELEPGETRCWSRHYDFFSTS
ncbi:hypothetical protein [Paenibacillus sp. SI8]|uniref:hypothetical protein n=1 Tax=unclassified Paenibacillus TaxID=185978 RepID=UPI003465D25F